MEKRPLSAPSLTFQGALDKGKKLPWILFQRAKVEAGSRFRIFPFTRQISLREGS